MKGSIYCLLSFFTKKKLTQSNEHHVDKILFRSANQKAKLRKWDMKWTIEWSEKHIWFGSTIIFSLSSRLGFNSFLAYLLNFGHNAAIRRCCYILCVSPKMCCIADNLFHLNTDTCTRYIRTHTLTQTHTDTDTYTHRPFASDYFHCLALSFRFLKAIERWYCENIVSLLLHHLLL